MQNIVVFSGKRLCTEILFQRETVINLLLGVGIFQHFPLKLASKDEPEEMGFWIKFEPSKEKLRKTFEFKVKRANHFNSSQNKEQNNILN